MNLVIFTTLLIEKSPQALPLGAACVASSVKNSPLTKNLCDVKLISFCKEDKEFQNKNFEDQAEFIAEVLIKQNPKVVGFSIFVWNRIVLEKVAKIIKKNGVKIIAGGPEVTANPSSFSEFDYVIQGEGEIKTPSIIYEIFTNKKLDFSLNESDYELNNFSSPYLDGTLNPDDYGGVLWELARGCPFKCSYCYESKGQKKVRFFPMERIKSELELFAKKNINQVFVLDPTYNSDKKRAIELLKLIAKKTPNTFYYFEARAEFIDRELADYFTKIPCSLQIGLQSSDENVLRLVNRNFNKKLFEKKVSILNEKGVNFGLDVIYGLPKDTLQGFKNSVDFAISLYPNNLEIFCLSVLPGTTLFDNAQKLNLTYKKNPPYNVLYSDSFSKNDILLAKKIADSCSFFYNNGRAVPWFNTICKTLKIRPSDFFIDFFDFNIIDLENSCCNHKQIEQMQIEFVIKKLTQKKLEKLITVTKDIIILNGAISRKTDTGFSETIYLNYPVEFLESELTLDLFYFIKNIKQKKSKFIS